MSYSSAQRVFYDDIYDEILPIHKKSFKLITDGSNIDLRLLLERVKRGDCVAKYSIGANFYNGVGTQRDLELSYKYTKEAAEDGYVPAMTNLAILYLNGHGIEKDMQKSLGWFGAAALQGDYRAQCNLGYLYESEPELSHDVDSCIFWYKKSSDNGYILAKISLALLYTTGVKVVEDRTKAEQLLSGINLSDDILSHIACSLLSMLYLQGRGGVPVGRKWPSN